jgi:hypothetical protein
MKYTDSGALISACGQFRYRLWRRWGEGARVLVFIMLNPSTADGEADDHTIRKCVQFAIRLGYDGIEIVNLFAFRSRSPVVLRASGYQVGPENNAHIKAVLSVYGHEPVVCAWGTNVRQTGARQRATDVLQMLADGFIDAVALELAVDGIPCHPLMLPYSDTTVRLNLPVACLV